VTVFGIDSAGYLQMADSLEARAAVYPVDPADVQIGLKVDPAIVPDILSHSLANIQNDKIGAFLLDVAVVAWKPCYLCYS
jgi:hypothetical protein